VGWGAYCLLLTHHRTSVNVNVSLSFIFLGFGLFGEGFFQSNVRLPELCKYFADGKMMTYLCSQIVSNSGISMLHPRMGVNPRGLSKRKKKRKLDKKTLCSVLSFGRCRHYFLYELQEDDIKVYLKSIRPNIKRYSDHLEGKTYMAGQNVSLELFLSPLHS
jgi:hypothetical protein